MRCGTEAHTHTHTTQAHTHTHTHTGTRTRTQTAPLTVRVVWCAAGILKSMLAANELKIGGSKEALVDRIIEAI